jgi:VanZ family protein
MENAFRRRWKLVAGLALLAMLYWPAMFVATHLPIRTTPVGDPYSIDKLEHLTAFAALAALLNALAAAIGLRSWNHSAAIVCFIAVYAMLDEATQLSPRTPEVLDWLADVIGATLGVGLYSLIARFWFVTSRAERPAE